MRYLLTIIVAISVGVLGALACASQGQEGDSAPVTAAAPTGVDTSGTSSSATGGMSFWQIVRASGIIGLLIFFLSIAGLALVIEHVLTIRRSVLIPPLFFEEVQEAIRAGQLGRLAQAGQLRESAFGRVLAAGLAEADLGWSAVEKAMEEALTEESARLYRKVEYLSVIGNLAPMLGLLGTVVGMIVAFRQVAETQGAARAADLAEGIYLALVTTVEGLLVAIPALGAFAFFRNKVDALIAEVALTAGEVLAPLKRQLLVGVAAPPRPGTMAGSRAPRGS